MNEGTEVQVQEEVVETTPEVVSASLSAGFNKVRGIEAEEQDKPAAVETPPAEVEPPQAAEPAQEPMVEALTPEEMRAALAKLPELEQFKGMTSQELQKLHGKMGEFNRTLQSLRAAGNPANSEAHKAAMQKFTSEYPDLAEIVTPLFQGVGGGGVSTEEITRIVDERVGQVKAETTQTIEQLRAELALTEQHPDWKTVINTPEYQAWLASRPETFRSEFLNTWDHGFVAKGLTEFKTWRSTTYKQQEAKQRRLAGAVTPTGVPSRTPGRIPDSKGLSAGFNRVRRAA